MYVTIYVSNAIFTSVPTIILNNLYADNKTIIMLNFLQLWCPIIYISQQDEKVQCMLVCMYIHVHSLYIRLTMLRSLLVLY